MTEPYTTLTPEEEARLLERCRQFELTADKLDRWIEISERQHEKLKELKETVAEQGRKLTRAETEVRDLASRLSTEAMMRPSIEVLQRMANGLDPFDRGRFQCAVAALPHEMPKLSASVATVFGSGGGIGDRLDAARRRREAAERGIRVIDGEGAPGP